jgi:hypothetical protein
MAEQSAVNRWVEGSSPFMPVFHLMNFEFDIQADIGYNKVVEFRKISK